MREPILVVNAGSSSVKFSLFETHVEHALTAAAHGQVDGIGSSARFEVSDADGRKLISRDLGEANHNAAIAAIHDWLFSHLGTAVSLAGVGHRVVHGGTQFVQPVRID